MNFNNTLPMKDLKGYLKWSEIQHILDIAKARSYRDYVLLCSLAYTGRRVSEVLGLRPQDIDYEQKLILWNILKRKNPTKQWKPANENYFDIISDYIEAENISEKDKVFPITRQRVFQIVRYYGEKAGLLEIGEKRIHPHHFRHSFAVWFAKNSETPSDLRALQQLLAHSNIGITECYLQFSQKDLKKVVNRMPEL